MNKSTASARHRRRRTTASFPALLLLALMATLLLYGCGSGARDDEDSESAGGRETTDGSRASETTGGTSGGEVGSGGDGSARDKPQAVKGLYVPGSVAGGERLDEVIELAEETEVNALVVDVKEAGHTTYPSEVPLAREIGATTEQIPDLEALVQRLEDNDIYTIARLSVFQDDVLPRERPGLAVKDTVTGGSWRTYQGATWTNPYRERAWEYNAAIAKEAAQAGFDEIQLDYVRFPSDGPMDRLEYGEKTAPTEEDAIAGFLEYTKRELEPTGAELSADVFGLIGINDFVGIGQVVSKMAPHLDVLSPMVYPSHYPPGAYGYQNPNAHPSEVIELAMRDFKEKSREANPDLEIRPWLQDFDYVSNYGPAEVRAQIRAAYGSGIEGWLLWNAAGDYTTEVLRSTDQ